MSTSSQIGISSILLFSFRTGRWFALSRALLTRCDRTAKHTRVSSGAQLDQSEHLDLGQRGRSVSLSSDGLSGRSRGRSRTPPAKCDALAGRLTVRQPSPRSLSSTAAGSPFGGVLPPLYLSTGELELAVSASGPRSSASLPSYSERVSEENSGWPIALASDPILDGFVPPRGPSPWIHVGGKSWPPPTP